MSLMDYGVESASQYFRGNNPYWDNKYEVDAKGFADENAWRYESLKRYDN